MKSIEEDSVKLKTFFMQKIGSDWNTASRRNSESRLGITRGKLPWCPAPYNFVDTRTLSQDL